jgi:hypothetical protein
MTILKVVQGYRFSRAHDRFYANGTTRYREDGSKYGTYTLADTCECGEWVFDGDPICAPLYDNENRVVHVNCCTDHDH